MTLQVFRTIVVLRPTRMYMFVSCYVWPQHLRIKNAHESLIPARTDTTRDLKSPSIRSKYNCKEYSPTKKNNHISYLYGLLWETSLAHS